jgi:hypothetical protein
MVSGGRLVGGTKTKAGEIVSLEHVQEDNSHKTSFSNSPGNSSELLGNIKSELQDPYPTQAQHIHISNCDQGYQAAETS